MKFVHAPWAALLATFLLPLAPLRAAAFEKAYWNDLRPHSLSAAEKEELDRQHIGTLYWKVGELVLRAGNWHWEDPPLSLPAAASRRMIPVVHVVASVPDPFEEPEPLLVKLRQAFSKETPGTLVIDFDCPPPLFASYAAFLTRLRAEAPELGITASADWIKKPGFAALAQSVAEMEVRFPDPAAARPTLKPGDLPLPSLSADEIRKAHWKKAPVRWRAILPNRATATVYAPSGARRTVFHGWSWSEFFATPSLVPVAPFAQGVVVFQSTRIARVANDTLWKNELLSISVPGRAALRESFDAVQEEGAAGAIFSFPLASDESSWSLRQLRDLTKTAVHFSLKFQEDRLVLANDGEADLPPHAETADDEGYLLELTAPAKTWSQVLPGDFSDVNGFLDMGEKEKNAFRRQQGLKGDVWRPIQRAAHFPVPPSRAKRLQLPFGTLRAGESLRSGWFRLNPTASPGVIRYRVLPIQTEWQPLD